MKRPIKKLSKTAQAFVAVCTFGGRMDAAESAYIARELEEIRAQTYDIKYPNLIARTLIPVNNAIPAGAEVVTYKQFDMVGAAAIIASYADDLPRSDVLCKSFSVSPKDLGASYGYNYREAKVAEYTGIPLDAKKAEAARRAVEQLIDKIGKTGDTSTGLLGLLNQPNTSLYTVPNGASGFPDWARKTPDEIIKDINGIINGIVSSTSEVEIPDTLLLPTEQYTFITSTPRSSNSDTTIAAYVLANNPYLKEIVPWNILNQAGASSADRMVAYRKDSNALEFYIPEEFNQLPPEKRNLEVIVDCVARCGGVVVFYPLSISYGDGI